MRAFLKFLGIIFLILILSSIVGSIYRLFNPETNFGEANIAVIEIEGVISDSLEVFEQLEQLKKNPNLKAVVVRVNSPGGAVGASQEIYLELKKLKSKMPVVISQGDLAASGGLYVSMGGSRIFSLPGTLTGSMGVLLELTNVSRLLEKIYIDAITLKSGELKDAGNPTTPLSPKAKTYLQDLINKNFDSFRKVVAAERKLKPEIVEMLSDGRVVDGEQAVKIGLSDELGTFSDAVEFAAKAAKISGESNLAYLSRKPKGWIERLMHEAILPIRENLKSGWTPLHYRLDLGK